MEWSFFSLRGGLVLFLTGLGIYQNFKNPKFGVFAFIILLFLRDTFLMRWFPPVYQELHLPQIFAIVAFVSWFFQQKEKIRFPLQLWLMFLLFGVICLSRLWGGFAVFSHKVPDEFFKMCILNFLIVNTINREKDLNQTIWVLIVSNTFVALYHYYYYKIGSYRSIYVLAHFGADRNFFAAPLAAVSSLAYFSVQGKKKLLTKLLAGFCLTCLVVGVILTDSRSGFVALAAALIGSILISKRYRVMGAILILAFGLIIGSRISEKYFDRLRTIQNYEQDASAMGRVATNQAAINMAKAHLLLGVGAGNFNHIFFNYTPNELKQFVKPGKSIHNAFLQIASETGLIGLLLFSLILLKSFIDAMILRSHCFRENPPNSLGYKACGLWTASFGYLVALQFLPGAYYSYIYIFIPLIVAAKQMQYDEVSVTSEVEEGVEKQRKPLLDGIGDSVARWYVNRKTQQFEER